MRGMTIHALEEYRKRENISLSALAQRLGMSKSVVCRYVKGTRQVGPETIRRISEITGIPARDLRPDLADILMERA
jgi:transcriptional regulator with XRE-family HTH domain